MKSIVVVPLALVALAGVSAPALAQTCTAPVVAVDVDDATASALFLDFLTTAGAPDPETTTISCDFNVPFNGAGYRVFSADFRGGTFIDTGQTFTLSETTPGSGDVVVVNGPEFVGYTEFDAAYYGAGPFSGIDLGYLITLEANGVGPALGTLDSIDFEQVAVVTEDDLQDSLDEVGTATWGALAHLGGSAGLFLGALEPINGRSSLNGTAAMGSYLAGVNGRFEAGPLTALGGVGVFSQDTTAGVSGILAAGAVRFVMPGIGIAKFFGEAGMWTSPNMTIALDRSYTVGLGVVPVATIVDATATGTGSVFTAYGRAGTVIGIGPGELVLSGTLAQTWLTLSPFSESTVDNFFAANYGGTSSSNTAKVNATYTLEFMDRFGVTVMAGIGRSFGGEMPVDVDFAGSQTATAEPFTFMEYGARAGFHISDNVSIDGFVLGTSGAEIGSHALFGGSVGLSF